MGTLELMYSLGSLWFSYLLLTLLIEFLMFLQTWICGLCWCLNTWRLRGGTRLFDWFTVLFGIYLVIECSKSSSSWKRCNGVRIVSSSSLKSYDYVISSLETISELIIGSSLLLGSSVTLADEECSLTKSSNISFSNFLNIYCFKFSSEYFWSFWNYAYSGFSITTCFGG